MVSQRTGQASSSPTTSSSMPTVKSTSQHPLPEKVHDANAFSVSSHCIIVLAHICPWCVCLRNTPATDGSSYVCAWEIHLQLMMVLHIVCLVHVLFLGRRIFCHDSLCAFLPIWESYGGKVLTVRQPPVARVWSVREWQRHIWPVTLGVIWENTRYRACKVALLRFQIMWSFFVC